jgi:predicted secreted protein
MALAVTTAYEEFVLEVEFTAGSGTFQTVCGLMDVDISRTNTTDSTEVPDCDDESLPFKIQRGVRTNDVTISATGVWALSSDAALKDWFYSGATKNVRIRNTKVVADGTTGDISAETMPMILTNLSNSRTKGQIVTAEIAMERNGDTINTLVA